jgi:hypothetical protein
MNKFSSMREQWSDEYCSNTMPRVLVAENTCGSTLMMDGIRREISLMKTKKKLFDGKHSENKPKPSFHFGKALRSLPAESKLDKE